MRSGSGSPGAGATLLRSVAWFDGAGSGMAVAVLAGWAVLGTILLLTGRARPVVGHSERARVVSEVPPTSPARS